MVRSYGSANGAQSPQRRLNILNSVFTLVHRVGCRAPTQTISDAISHSGNFACTLFNAFASMHALHYEATSGSMMQRVDSPNPQACDVSRWQVRAKHFICRLHASWIPEANVVLHGEPETQTLNVADSRPCGGCRVDLDWGSRGCCRCSKQTFGAVRRVA